MKKALYLAFAALIALPALAADNTEPGKPCSAPCTVKAKPAEKDVAVVHFNQLKERKLDGTAKDLTLVPIIGTAGRTTYFILRNDAPNARKVTVSILDLTEPEYDVYVCGSLIGVKKKEQLEAGIPISFSGTLIPPAYRDYYTRIKTRGEEGSKRYEGTDKDFSVCKSVLAATADWVKSIERGDGTMRSESIIVVPAGTPFSLPGVYLMPDKPKDFPAKMEHLGEAIHIMRREIARKVKNLTYRNDTIETMTPMDHKLVFSGPLTPGKVVTVRAAFTNWTERLITGKVKLNVPSGWKVKAVAPTVKMPGYSTKAEATFEVTIPKTAKPNAAITAEADLMVQDVALKIQMK